MTPHKSPVFHTLSDNDKSRWMEFCSPVGYFMTADDDK